MSTTTPENRAAANNYRFMDSAETCNNCCRKQAVPWFWCPQVDRQVHPHMTCNQHAPEVK